MKVIFVKTNKNTFDNITDNIDEDVLSIDSPVTRNLESPSESISPIPRASCDLSLSDITSDGDFSNADVWSDEESDLDEPFDEMKYLPIRYDYDDTLETEQEFEERFPELNDGWLTRPPNARPISLVALVVMPASPRWLLRNVGSIKSD